MSPHRLLFLNSVQPESFGGGERWMVTAAAALAARGHAATLAGRPGSRFLASATAAGLPTEEIPFRGDADPRTVRALRQLYRDERIDVVLANFNKDVRLAGLARFPGRRPRVLARNGLAILPNNLRYRLTYRRLADGIVTNTESIRSRYLAYGWVPPEFVHVVHNGIDLPPPDARSAREVRAALGLPADGRWIGAFGRMVTQKRFDLLLEAVARMVPAVPDVRVLLVGDGPESDTLAEIAERLGLTNRVFAVGFQAGVGDWYRAADLVALTSASEGLPNAVLEAMAHGRATVCFDVGGVRELVPDATCGRVVPPLDVAALASAATELLRDDTLRARIGASAAARVRTEFSIPAMTDRLETILADLLGATR